MPDKRTPIIALDFDGTLVRHEYPEIGADIGAVPWLLQILEEFTPRFILYTMRSGSELSEAEFWCAQNAIRLWAVNENPQQSSWTESPKVYAHLYVDDAALGIPMLRKQGCRAWVNWALVGPAIIDWCRRFYS